MHMENGPLELTAVLSSDSSLHDLWNTDAASVSKGWNTPEHYCGVIFRLWLFYVFIVLTSWLL